MYLWPVTELVVFDHIGGCVFDNGAQVLWYVTGEVIDRQKQLFEEFSAPVPTAVLVNRLEWQKVKSCLEAPATNLRKALDDGNSQVLSIRASSAQEQNSKEPCVFFLFLIKATEKALLTSLFTIFFP